MSKIVSRVALTAGALSLNIVLRKYASRVSTALDEAAEVQAETAKTQTHAQVTQRLVARTLSDSQEVLRHLADQPLEASTADIQQACASNEQFIRALLRVPASGGAVASALIDVLADCDDRGISVSVECDGDRFTAGQSTAAVVTQLDVVRELIATDNVTSTAIVCVGEHGTCYIRITLTGHTQTFLRVAPGIQVSDTGPSDTNRTVELTWNVNDSSEQPLALA